MENLVSKEFDDIYFSVEDGLAESRYVFLEQNDLPAMFARRDNFTICETGFGTGLNFLCAWTLFEETARENQHLTYISFEKFPLAAVDILRYLDRWKEAFGGRLERLAAAYPLKIGGWHKIRISARVTLLLVFDDVNRALPQLDRQIDCWFLDGHAPAKNPDMWSDTLFSNMGRLSREGTRAATFTAAGFVKRGLEQSGFSVSKVKGFGRKREMITGIFTRELKEEKGRKKPEHVAVIGAGIAGATIANALCARGIRTDLYDRSGIADGASGNIRGLFNPRFTAHRSEESDFYGSGFGLTLRLFETVASIDKSGYEKTGTLHLITDEKKEKRLKEFVRNCGWHTDHARIVRPGEASMIAGVQIRHEALYLPDAGLISPRNLVEILAQDIPFFQEDITPASLSNSAANEWIVNGRSYDTVIFANASGIRAFDETAHFPVQNVRGQVTMIDTPSSISSLRCNLCYGGYACAPFDGKMVIGSTFQPWMETPEARDEDDNDNLSGLRAIIDGLNPDIDIIGHRVGFRCAAHDRRPIIGAIEGKDGLYISAGHGSHGLVSAPLGAELLASMICGEVQPIPTSAATHISPARFNGK